MKKRVAIVGVGGRTGTMFSFEIGRKNDVLGIARKDTIEFFEKNKLYVDRGNGPILFKEKVIEDVDFSENNNQDIVFLTNKNPVSVALKYYFQKCGLKKPIFVLSQNGINAINSAKKTLGEIAKLEDIKVVRMVLFNAIDRKQDCFKYSVPIKVALSQALGDTGVEEVYSLLKDSGFRVSKFSKKDAQNLEFSKLFLNLIGMASASRGLSISDGFQDKEVFIEEIEALKEYIEIVRSAGGKLLSFPGYPIHLFLLLLSLPTSFLVPFRNKLSDIINKGRGNKPKDLDEIDYYNGAVVNLAHKVELEKTEKLGGIDYNASEFDIAKGASKKALINQKIYWRVLEKFKNF